MIRQPGGMQGSDGGNCCLVAQSCLTLCNPVGCSTPGFPKEKARALMLTLPAQCPEESDSDSLSIRAAISLYLDTPGVTYPSITDGLHVI